MARAQETKRRRSDRFAPERLEDRLALSAVGPAARDAAAVDRLDAQLHAQVARLDARLLRRTAQLDREDPAALGVAAARLSHGDVAAAEVHLARSTARVDRLYGHLARHLEQRGHALTAHVNRRLGRASARLARSNPAIRSVALATRAPLHDDLAAIGGALVDEVEATREATRVVGPASAALVQARATGVSPMARASAAVDQLGGIARSERAAGQAAFMRPWAGSMGRSGPCDPSWPRSRSARRPGRRPAPMGPGSGRGASGP